MQEIKETWVQTLGQKNPLEKEMETHSSILVGKIPWTKEPGELTVHGVTKSQTRLCSYPEGQHIYPYTPGESIVCFLLFGVCVCVCVCVCTSVSLFRFWFLQVFAEDHWYLMSLFRIHREWTLIWFYFCPLMSRTKTFLLTFEIEFLAWGNNADFRFRKMKFSVSSQLWDLGKDVWRSCTSISFYIK